jgi:HK97 family phage prohead protease
MIDKKKESKEILHRYFRAQVRNVDSTSFTVDALVSDGTCDRHGTVIKPDAWKKDLRYFKDHPILLASHDHLSLLSQIGEAQSIKTTDEGLMCKFKYYVGEGNPEADWAFKLAERGMAMYSVGFIPHEYEDPEYKEDKKKDPIKDPWRVYTRTELAEVSQVTVGSNRNALQRVLENVYPDGKGNDPDDEVLAELAGDIIEFLKKGEMEELQENADKHICECVDCNHTIETEKHCDKLKCPECGGQMRRKERPGPGKKDSSPQEEDSERAEKTDHPDPTPMPSLIEGETMGEGVVSRPYPEEHACRLRDPSDFKADSFRRTKRKHEGKEYSIIMGKLKNDDTMTEQAYRYKKDVWTEKEAKKHCDDHDGEFEAAKKDIDEMVMIKNADLEALKETINKLFTLMEKINKKLGVFTSEELQRLFGGRDTGDDLSTARDKSKSDDVTGEIFKKNTDEDKGQSSNLSVILKEAEKLIAKLKR